VTSRSAISSPDELLLGLAIKIIYIVIVMCSLSL